MIRFLGELSDKHLLSCLLAMQKVVHCEIVSIGLSGTAAVSVTNRQQTGGEGERFNSTLIYYLYEASMRRPNDDTPSHSVAMGCISVMSAACHSHYWCITCYKSKTKGGTGMF